MNLFAYDCPKAILPSARVSGHIDVCTEKDVDELTSFLDRFHEEVQVDRKSMEEYREDAGKYAKTVRRFPGRHTASMCFLANKRDCHGITYKVRDCRAGLFYKAGGLDFQGGGK